MDTKLEGGGGGAGLSGRATFKKNFYCGCSYRVNLSVRAKQYIKINQLIRQTNKRTERHKNESLQ